MTMHRLLALSEILPGAIPPVAVVDMPPQNALYAIAAEDVAIPQGWPLQAIAREPGYAVRARMLIGATAYEPALLSPVPPLLEAGEPVPAEADAILPAALAHPSPAGLEVFTTLPPGEGLRRAAQDWPAGHELLSAGTRIGPVEQALLLAMEVPAIPVRRVTMSLDSALPEPIRALFAGWAARLGVMASPPAEAHLRIEACGFGLPRLALRPGRLGHLRREGNGFVLSVPPALAEAVGLWHGLALPLLAGLSGANPETFEGVLAGKIVSSVGFAELAFLACFADGWQPLEIGDLALATLARVEAVALMPAGSEGRPSGETLALSPLGGAFTSLG